MNPLRIGTECKDEFPWRTYTKEELINELSRLSRIANTRAPEPLPFSVTGYKCSNFFFQTERMATPGRGGTRSSTIEFWYEQQERIIEYSIRNERDFFSTLNFMNHAPSQFPPVTAGRIYNSFGATHVFDPYAGWGDRCVAAIGLGIKYTGVDSNKNLEPLYENMIKFYNAKEKVKMYFKKCQDINVEEISFDFVFSSPPFWSNKRGAIPTLVERYNGTQLDYTRFVDESLVPIVMRCRKYAIVCLYLPENMYIDLEEHIGQCDSTILLKTSQQSRKSPNMVYCWNRKI